MNKTNAQTWRQRYFETYACTVLVQLFVWFYIGRKKYAENFFLDEFAMVFVFLMLLHLVSTAIGCVLFSKSIFFRVTFSQILLFGLIAVYRNKSCFSGLLW